MNALPAPVPSMLSRRGFLTGAAAVAGGALLSSCSSGGSGRPRVREWNLFAGGDGARFVAMQDGFRAQNPEIDLVATTLPWGPPFYTKLAMAAAGGRAPEVATVHASRLRTLSPTTLLDPWPQDLLAEVGITRDRFLPAAWDRCVVDGQLYAVPLDTHMVVQYYNTDLAAAAGLLGTDGKLRPTTGPDELVEQLRAFKSVSGSFGASMEAVQPWRVFASLYAQQDGELLDAEGRTVVLDDDKAGTVLELLRRLAIDEAVVPGSADYPACVALFGSGAAGSCFNGEWEVTTYQAASLPFGMAQFPDVFGNRAGLGDSHTYVLPRSAGRDEAALRATIAYVAHMVKDSLEWARGGHVPAYQPVAGSAEYGALTPQSDYAAAAEAVVLDPAGWFSGSGSILEQEANAALGSVMTGAQSTSDAVRQLRTALGRLVATPSPV